MQKSLREEIKFLEAKLAKNPASILFARLADAYLQSDRLDDAIDLCEKGIKKHPYYVTGHYILGKCYLRKKLFDQAEKELKRVLLFDSKYIAAHRDYGELMAQIGWNNTCEMSYEEILRIDPFNEKARRRLEELREQLALSPETQRESEEDLEFDEVEENILTGVSNSLEEPPPEHREEEAESTDNLDDFADSDELFREFDEHDQDEKANIDLLEDIFNDEKTSEIDLKAEDTPNIEEEEKNSGFTQDHIEEQISETFDEDSAKPDEPAEMSGDMDTRQSQNEEESSKDSFDTMDDSDIYHIMNEEPSGFDERQVSEDDSTADDQKVDEEFHELDEEEVRAIMSDDSYENEEDDSENMFNIFPKGPEPEQQSVSEQESLSHERKKEKIVTPTLGEIYAAQHQYSKAIGVYEILRKKDPDNEFYTKKIEYLQQKLEESQAE